MTSRASAERREASPPVNDGKLFITAMRALPKKPLSRAVRGLAGVHSQMAVRRFAARYKVALDEAEKPIDAYPSIRDFFTRRLKPGARPLDSNEGALLSPVDGVIDQHGRIESGQLIQAKGRNYTLAALLADEVRARRYEGGTFATIYLAPRDYHRIHSPANGRVLGSTYVPGELFPVNPAAVTHIDALFAKNERVITHLDTDRFGSMELIMVGATCVGHMRVAYDPAIATNTGQTEISIKNYDPHIPIARGDDLGVFEMGSTVILILDRAVRFDDLPLGTSVRMGRRIGALI